MELKLYSYWRSSTSYKVRIALNLKGLDYDLIPVHLVNNGGEQHSADYKTLNPMQALPTLIDGDTVITQSNAILEYLEDVYPEVALLPNTPQERAYVRQVMNVISCDIHPVNNLRVLKYLTGHLEISQEAKSTWYHHWIQQGFGALEKIISSSPYYAGSFCHGLSPSIADATLIPQIYNAKRFDVDLAAFPAILNIDKNCATLKAFEYAKPENQIDMEHVK